MPILFNNVAFNDGGTAISNNVSLEAINYGSTRVWQAKPPPLVFYDGAAGINNRMTVYSPNAAYYNGETTSYAYPNGDKVWQLTPWTSGDPNERRGACLYTTEEYELTRYTRLYVTWCSQTGFGDAARNCPRCTWYVPAYAPVDPWDTVNVVARGQDDGDYAPYRTSAIDITAVTGWRHPTVANWAAGGASTVWVRRFWAE